MEVKWNKQREYIYESEPLTLSKEKMEMVNFVSQSNRRIQNDESKYNDEKKRLLTNSPTPWS
jgi:hypothetical protein